MKIVHLLSVFYSVVCASYEVPYLSRSSETDMRLRQVNKGVARHKDSTMILQDSAARLTAMQEVKCYNMKVLTLSVFFFWQLAQSRSHDFVTTTSKSNYLCSFRQFSTMSTSDLIHTWTARVYVFQLSTSFQALQR